MIAYRQGRPGRLPRNGSDTRNACTDDLKTEPLKGRARGNEGLGSAQELYAAERAPPFADRPGRDVRLAGQWLRLLHPHAYERGAHPRRDRRSDIGLRDETRQPDALRCSDQRMEPHCN